MLRSSLESSPHPAIGLPVSGGLHLLAPPRFFDPMAPEWIDQPGIDPAMVREELDVLEDANRRFGGHQLALHYVKRLVSASSARHPRILDLGTGAADIPRTIAGWFRERGCPVSILAIDRNPSVLRVARENCRDWPEIQFEQHDVLALPFAPRTFDVVLCSLALHHFSSAQAVVILRSMQQIARVGYVLNDLRRNWLSVLSTEVLARTVIRSPIARHDAPQSCRASFTVPELRALAQQAGLRNFRIRRHHAVFRMVLEGRN